MTPIAQDGFPKGLRGCQSNESFFEEIYKTYLLNRIGFEKENPIYKNNGTI